MIKVLQVGATNVLGGIEIYLYNYYNNIDRKKVKFDFVNMYDNICFEDEYLNNGSKIHKLPNYRIHPFKYINSLKKILIREKYDILHFNMNSSIFLYPLIAAKMANIPVIIAHSHNASSDRGIIKKILHNICKLFIPLFANYYFACSNYAGKWFFSKKIMKGNSYYIINNAIDIDKFKFNNKKRKIMRKELKIMDNEILIGHIGRFIKQKNHNFIIEVLKDLVLYDKNFKLLLVGVGNLKTMIEEKVKINKLENNVIFLGQRGDVNKIYQAMDIFLLPSLYEGLPLVGIEAQIAGCKCFFSNKITKDVRIKDDTEFLKISNSKEWAEKIVDYVKKEKNREESYCKEYDIRKSAEKLCRLYKSCMERK